MEGVAKHGKHDSTWHLDGDQVEEENEIQVQDSQRQISSSSFIPQRITRSKAKDLGSRLQMFSLFMITFV